MPTARDLMSGYRQAVRLPKDFRVNVAEVSIFRRDEATVRRASAGRGLERAFEVLTRLPVDFLHDGRQDEQPQRRHSLRCVYRTGSSPYRTVSSLVVLVIGLKH